MAHKSIYTLFHGTERDVLDFAAFQTQPLMDILRGDTRPVVVHQAFIGCACLLPEDWQTTDWPRLTAQVRGHAAPLNPLLFCCSLCCSFAALFAALFLLF
jgi:hypothetical protein